MSRKPSHWTKGTYTQWHVLMASPTKPMAPEKARHQLTRMHLALSSIADDAKPTVDAWRVLSDCVNLLDTLVKQSPVKHSYLIGNVRHYAEYEIKDEDRAIMDAIKHMAHAGDEQLKTGVLRFNAAGIEALRNCVSHWVMLVEQLPERVIIKCHMDTERRLQEILRNPSKRRAGDVVVGV